MKSRAAVAWESNAPLSVEEIDVAGPNDDEVLIRNIATGVCHTDAYTLSGADPEGVFPAILGHEGGAVVEEVGKSVKSVAPGDHVIPLYRAECGECKLCKSPKTNLCLATRATQGRGLLLDGTSRFSKNGTTIYHFMGTSTFSEYTVLPEISVAKIDKNAPLDKICLLGCGITTGIGAVRNTAQVTPGSTVVVFGLGAIGMSVVQGARLAEASRIVGVDLNPDKFDFAFKMGATDCINPNEYEDSIVKIIVDMLDGGADYSFECIGNVEVMKAALECCHIGWGESTIIGVAAAGEEIHTRPVNLITGRVWRGTPFGDVKGRTGVPKYVDSYMGGDIIVDDFITHTMGLEDINRAFDLMHEGKSIRSVIYF